MSETMKHTPGQEEMDSISVFYLSHGQNCSMTRSEGAEILLANGATEFEIDELWQAAPGSAFFVDDTTLPCPKCKAETVEDFTDNPRAGLDADNSNPIYFDTCPECDWNNGPTNERGTK